jgi:hypothetical protein
MVVTPKSFGNTGTTKTRSHTMSDLPTTQSKIDEVQPTVRQDVDARTASSLEDVALQPAPALISEQAVLFGTAAALSRSQRPTRRARVIAAMGRIFTKSSESPRKERRKYAPRDGFLEDSRMDRERYRL